MPSKKKAVGTDAAVDGHHVDSKIEPLPDNEKAGPASIQSREITPAERGVQASAFGEPAEE